MAGPQLLMPRARDADAFAVLVDDLLRRLFRGGFVAIDADDVRAFLHQSMSRSLADAGARAE